MFNALLEFKRAHSSRDRLPTEYAKTWVDENIQDVMPISVKYKEKDDGRETNISSDLNTRRELHEAYAEYSKGNVMKRLVKDGIVSEYEISPSELFKNMDGPEGRKSFLNLKAAIDEHAESRRSGKNV
jgi:hypothetical protein